MDETYEIQIELVKKKIQELVAKGGTKYLDIISIIVDYEKKHKDDRYYTGWEMENIEGLNGGMIAQMKQAGIIAPSYRSNKYHTWMLSYDIHIYELALEKIYNELETEMKAYDLPPVDTSNYTEKFNEIIKKYDMLDYWARFINPKVTGLENVKQALLLSIASTGDRYGDRGRIHVLLYGDPGTAKSELMLWIHHYLGAKYATHRSSDAGLMGGAVGNEIVMGALPRADGHVIAIDELDKFNAKDFAGLLEAMSDGKVTITLAKGEVEKTFNASVRVIAGCNRIDKFPPELLDRFDFKIKMERPDREEEKRIIGDMIDSWFVEKPSYDGVELRAYLQWISNFEPEIKERKIIKKLIQMYVDLRGDEKGNIRRDESIMRVAYTIAKLNKRDVMPEDVIRAIGLIDETMTEGKLRGLRLLIEKERLR